MTRLYSRDPKDLGLRLLSRPQRPSYSPKHRYATTCSVDTTESPASAPAVSSPAPPITRSPPEVVAQSFEAAAKRVVGLTPQGYLEWDIDRNKAGAKTMVSVMWAMRQFDVFAALSRLRVPALVLFGESTPIADSRGVYAQRLPEASVLTLAGCGHLPMVENAPALVQAVLDWSSKAK